MSTENDAQIKQLTAENVALRRSANVSECLFNISQLYTFDGDLSELYREIYNDIKNVLSIDNFYIAIRDDEMHIPCRVDVKDQFEEHQLNESTNPQLRTGLTAYALNKGSQLMLTRSEIESLEASESLTVVGEMPAQWVFLPFKSEDIVGGLSIQSYSNESSYSEQDIELLGQIAYHVGNVLGLRKTKEELQAHMKEIDRAQVQLVQSEKMASIGQLAAGVAHEINNPLGYVNSNLNSLKSYLSDIADFCASFNPILEAQDNFNDHPLKDVIEKIKALEKELDIEFLLEDINDMIDESIFGMNKVKDIVQSLKNFSRVDQDDIQEANINQCIEETLKIVWNDLKYKCEVEKDFGDIPDIFCYAGQLNQVIMNMLVNAGHAIEDKGTITLKTWQEGDHICMSFGDTGKGIDPDHIQHLFEPFFTTKPVGQGTGLGLSISYGIIVEKHGGEISVESEKGVGTTFLIRLPITSLKQAYEEQQKEA